MVTNTYIFALVEDALNVLFNTPLQWFVGCIFVVYVIGIVRKLFNLVCRF